jgi:hypothetical protein
MLDKFGIKSAKAAGIVLMKDSLMDLLNAILIA